MCVDTDGRDSAAVANAVKVIHLRLNHLCTTTSTPPHMRRPHTLNSSSCTLANRQNLPTAASCPNLVLTPFGACRLPLSQLLGAAGPGGGLSPARNRRREPGLGGGASTSAICSRRRRCGGTVRWDTTSVNSFMRSGVGRGVCSRRSWEMRSLTDCGAAGPAVASRADAGGACGFMERKAGWCFLGMLF